MCSDGEAAEKQLCDPVVSPLICVQVADSNVRDMVNTLYMYAHFCRSEDAIMYFGSQALCR